MSHVKLHEKNEIQFVGVEKKTKFQILLVESFYYWSNLYVKSNLDENQLTFHIPVMHPSFRCIIT